MAKRKPPARPGSSGHPPGRPPGRPGKRPDRAPKAADTQDRYWLYGLHAAAAALANPEREVLRALATPEALERLEGGGKQGLAARGLTLERAGRGDLDALLPAGAVHQGLALEVRPLEPPTLAQWLDQLEAESAGGPSAAEAGPAPRRRLLLALDQVSDPHNVGAVLRSAAAFGALAVLAPRHGQAPETGVLAKAASGALDHLPYLDAGNLARALELLKERGFWILGLASEGADELSQADPGGPLVLVLGGEGKGLRRLTREACDLLARLPTRPPIDQLNVSNAAAVALYELLGRAR